jgi:hypothetical protein
VGALTQWPDVRDFVEQTLNHIRGKGECARVELLCFIYGHSDLVGVRWLCFGAFFLLSESGLPKVLGREQEVPGGHGTDDLLKEATWWRHVRHLERVTAIGLTDANK